MTWKNTTLRAVADVALGRQRAPQHATGPNMVPYLRAANVKDGVLDLDDVLEMNFTPNEQKIFSLRPGDILVTEGSGSRSVVGSSAVWHGEISGTVCFQNTLLRLRPRSGATDPRYLAWWAQAARTSGQFASIAGGANIYHLSADRVRQLPVAIPALEEQRRIADFLDARCAHSDQVATTFGRLVALTDERFTGLLESTLEGSRQSTVRLSFLLSRPMSYGASEPARSADPEWPRYIRITDIGADGKLRDDTFSSLPPEVAKPYLLEDGDLLFARSGATVGKTFLYRGEFGRAAYAGYLIRAQFSDRVLPEYVNYFCQSPLYWQQIRSESVTATIQNVNAERYGNMSLPYCDLKRQVSIVAELSRHEDAIRRTQKAAKRQIALLRERRQALITAAVTGQIDVTTARGLD
jgi:type I restriction enzyme S subunit